MCGIEYRRGKNGPGTKTVPVNEAVGMVIAHDITEIRPGEFKGMAFKKGHVVREEDIRHLRRLGKENLFILEMGDDEMHENEAALAIANAIAGSGVKPGGEPREGKIEMLAAADGLLKVNREALRDFNMLGEVMCASLHTNSVVREGQVVAGTRAIPLVVKRSIIEDAVRIAGDARGILSVRHIRRPRAGIVITGNEVYFGRVKDAFKPLLTKKIQDFRGEIVGVYYAPDDSRYIKDRITELIHAGADLIITTGGMSVDPDDVTPYAIGDTGVKELTYGSPVLPGSMFLIAYAEVARPQSRPLNGQTIPILGIPACGMYHNTTVLDMVLPRVLAGERIGRTELAELGHGGLCLKCTECRYPLCPFGK